MRKSRIFYALILAVAVLQTPPANGADDIWSEMVKKRNYKTTPLSPSKQQPGPPGHDRSTLKQPDTKSAGKPDDAGSTSPSVPESAQTNTERTIAAMKKRLETTLAQPDLDPEVRKSTEGTLRQWTRYEQQQASARARLAAQKAQVESGKQKWSQLVSFMDANQEEESLIGKVVALKVPAPQRNLNPNEMTELKTSEGINCRLKWNIRLQAQNIKFATPQIMVTGTIDSIDWENRTVTINVKGLGGAG